MAKRILIYRLGSLGDFVVALPCFHLIRQTYPDARIVLMTNSIFSGKAVSPMKLLEGSGLCDESVDYPEGLRDPKALLALRRTIKAHAFDFGVELNSDREWWQALCEHMFLRSCGIGKLVGTPLGKRDMRPLRRSAPVVEQECSRLARRLQEIGSIDVRDRSMWNLGLNASERDTADALLQEENMPQGFVSASVGTKLPVKDWGVENWTNFASLLSKAHPALGLVLIGAPDESALSEAVRKAWAGPSLNLCGRSSPRVSAAVIERSALFVGQDSGPMHLASAVGTAVVAVFSWHNPPGQWHPGCIDWKNIRVFYPPLPNGVWRRDLQFRRSSTEGILLINPQEVARACSALLPCRNK
jgi:ADP-heptose:LPS heptosyltransferase